MLFRKGSERIRFKEVLNPQLEFTTKVRKYCLLIILLSKIISEQRLKFFAAVWIHENSGSEVIRTPSCPFYSAI
ncbi:hypothetical protein Pint_35544 [Pistacia integerrima]|uniref:Uncharacterized protein n=1 Tax=Pistacia integerrima TaxID=434235 RepID=A0ACC0XYX8_9ROSI|nr:hypothetical protein Pint_35544 [Pistacia integerrima]